MRNRNLVMTTLAGIGMVLVWRAQTAPSAATSTVAAASATSAAAPAARAAGAASAVGTPRPSGRAAAPAIPLVAALSPRTTAAVEAESDKDTHTLFGSRSWTPPPPPPPPPAPPPPPPKPVAPALPFTYLGKMLADGKWQAYLARGEDTFVVHEHSQIDANYRAENITPPTMTIVYLPLKQTQVMAIGADQ